LDDLEVGKVYQLVVFAFGDLQASLLLSQNTDLTIVSDGFDHSLFYEKNFSHESRFLSYLPPSNKFQLTVQSSIDAIDALYAISIKKFSTKGRRILQARNTENMKPANGTTLD